MTAFGMYGGKKFQNEQREKLLGMIDVMIHGDESLVKLAGMYTRAFCEGMRPFGDQLDSHNLCLLLNAIYQSDKILGRKKSK